jgi:transposase
MNGYSEDLRRRIVSAIERGTSKAQAARSFEVSLYSVRRYIEKANRGESASPEEEPQISSETRREGHKATGGRPQRGRPFASLQDRCEYIEAVTGLSVSRSTMCRAIARMGSTRKKGDE